MAVRPESYRFTVDEYHAIADAGILTEDDRTELVEGEIIVLNPIGSRHAAAVKRLAHAFATQAKSRFLVSVQDPIRLDGLNEPQPDLALLAPRDDFYAAAHPGPADVFLVIEVCETSAVHDRTSKIPLYARAGIGEAWLIDLAGRRLEVFTSASDTGYSETVELQARSQLSPRSFPDLVIDLEGLFT